MIWIWVGNLIIPNILDLVWILILLLFRNFYLKMAIISQLASKLAAKQVTENKNCSGMLACMPYWQGPFPFNHQPSGNLLTGVQIKKYLALTGVLSMVSTHVQSFIFHPGIPLRFTSPRVFSRLFIRKRLFHFIIKLYIRVQLFVYCQ